jgi:hypothetical protein
VIRCELSPGPCAIAAGHTTADAPIDNNLDVHGLGNVITSFECQTQFSMADVVARARGLNHRTVSVGQVAVNLAIASGPMFGATESSGEPPN